MKSIYPWSLFLSSIGIVGITFACTFAEGLNSSKFPADAERNAKNDCINNLREKLGDGRLKIIMSEPECSTDPADSSMTLCKVECHVECDGTQAHVDPISIL